jgi:hypothetical protein
MDGALSRVPTNFYEYVWSILERTPQGIKLCGILLPQVNFGKRLIINIRIFLFF